MKWVWLWVGMMMWVGGYDEVGGVSGVVKLVGHYGGKEQFTRVGGH